MTREPTSTVESFKIGDRIRLRRRFTHLYPDQSGVIINVVPDPIRPLFNEYTVEFPNEAKASLFHFQLLRDESSRPAA
jgi:hypothetical protein